MYFQFIFSSGLNVTDVFNIRSESTNSTKNNTDR